jgi:hypothetical protein
MRDSGSSPSHPEPPIEIIGLLPILAGSPNASIIVDRDGTIVYANPRVGVLLGYGADDLIGRRVEDLVPSSVAAIHDAKRRSFFARPSARPMGVDLHLAARRKDGTELPVEISLTPITAGEQTLAIATIVDISERREAAARLEESERRFRSVLEASPNAIVAVDAAGLIVFANPQVESTFGYAPEELLNQPIGILLPESRRERHLQHREAFFRHPTARPMGIGLDLAGRHKDGTEFPVEISLAPVVSPEGPQVFATVVDITARKDLESSLLQAEKLQTIGRLAGGIAHDFNNMLSAIRGYADLILDALPDDPIAPVDTVDLGRSARAIVGASDRAAQLTGQLLAFARQQNLRPRIVDLGEAVEAVEPLLRRLIGERIVLQVTIGDDVGRIRVDTSQLDQMIINLVVNARDALPDGGTITIETSRTTIDAAYAIEHFDVDAGDYVVLAVTDNGVGMDMETKRHIFEPFFTTKDLGQGTGLGLATTYGTVRQSGGHIWLYSEPGLGTTFKLFFPRVGATTETVEAPHGVPADISSSRILVVEDEEMVRDLLVAVLRRAGHTVDSTADGAAALDMLEGGTLYGVVISDVVMPAMRGTELARIILDRFPATGVLLLSGYTAETLNLSEVLERGARFLDKPFSSDQLLLAVAEAMRTRV